MAGQQQTGGDVVAGSMDDAPILITEAQPSYDDQLAKRKRKYFVMMACRVPCLILAAVFVNTPWLALTMIGISVPLPWIAVLIANDRPAQRASRFNPFRRTTQVKELESRDHPVIEG
jgi:uncharacterized membrane protein